MYELKRIYVFIENIEQTIKRLTAATVSKQLLASTS